MSRDYGDSGKQVGDGDGLPGVEWLDVVAV